MNALLGVPGEIIYLHTLQSPFYARPLKCMQTTASISVGSVWQRAFLWEYANILYTAPEQLLFGADSPLLYQTHHSDLRPSFEWETAHGTKWEQGSEPEKKDTRKKLQRRFPRTSATFKWSVQEREGRSVKRGVWSTLRGRGHGQVRGRHKTTQAENMDHSFFLQPQ